MVGNIREYVSWIYTQQWELGGEVYIHVCGELSSWHSTLLYVMSQCEQ